ncbi:MAG: hypothetical protein ACLP1Y_00935 [Candidatus Acidiferrales bacterium]
MERFNYFNYYTEIEEYFWRKRGAHLLVSPLDWAILETWQQAGISLPAVLKGIDRAFESYARSRRGAGRPLKSLAYCAAAVLDAAEEEKETAAGAGPQATRAPREETFSREELRGYFSRNQAQLELAAEKLGPGAGALAEKLKETGTRMETLLPILDGPGNLDLEDLERRMTVLEEKLTAAMVAAAPEETLLGIRRELDRQLSAYRGKMTAEQLRHLEQKYVEKRLWEHYKVPRLSLFYLPAPAAESGKATIGPGHVQSSPD